MSDPDDKTRQRWGRVHLEADRRRPFDTNHAEDGVTLGRIEIAFAILLTVGLIAVTTLH